MFSASIERASLVYGAALGACVLVAAAAVVISFESVRVSLARADRLAATDRTLSAVQREVYRQTKTVLRRATLTTDGQGTDFDEAARAIDRELGRLAEAPEELRSDIALMVEALHSVRAQLQVAMQRPAAELATVFDPARGVDPVLVYEWRLTEIQTALAAARDANLAAGLRATMVSPGIALGAAAAIGLLLLLGQRRLLAALRRPIATLVAAADETTAGQKEREVPDPGPREFLPLQQAINRMMRALEQSREARLRSETQAALGALVPIVAHNIRNPLASIRAAAQVADGDTPEEARETLRAIIGTVDRLESWLSSLLGYLNPRQLRFAILRAADPVRSAQALLAHQGAARAVRVEFGAIDDAALVWGDPHLLEQATCALLANAIEASPEGSRVVLGVAQGRGESAIAVEDDGAGMPFSDSESRAGASFGPGPTTKALGTGLGVPFARRVADLHGGRLSFERRASGGTRATIIIPHAPPANWSGPGDTDASE